MYKRLFKRLITKTGLKMSLFPVLVALVGLALSAVFSRLDLSAVIVVICAAWAVVQLLLIDLRFDLVDVQRNFNNLARNAATGANQNRMETRIRALSRVVSDIAGSTGKMAPRVRSIEASVASGAATHGATIQSRAGVAPSTTRSMPPLGPSAVHNDYSAFRTIEDIVRKGAAPQRSKVRALVVADEFTSVAFASEWHQTNPTPHDWRSLLDSGSYDLLFVESAWEGNAGTWRYHLVGQSAPRPAIVDLVSACKERGIPTVFWNKEDPPHFEEFLDTARLFDHVFTTEESLLDTYKTAVGHSSVHVLPFAVQPLVHNPGRLGNIRRTSASVFGGMYFREKYPERRQQMDYLLPAAKKHSLDIYSRNTAELKYQFPDRYVENIRGSLPYPAMVAAYHGYRVVINVNSVPNSNSMCARRIFEATACGAAVVSPPSDAIARFFPGGHISTPDNEASADSMIRALLRSDVYRDRLVHAAQREVWENHLYSHRVKSILTVLGKESSEESEVVSVFITTNRPHSFESIIDNLRRQTFDNIELVVGSHGFNWDSEVVEKLRGIPGISRVVYLPLPADSSLGENLNTLVDNTSGDFLIRMDDDDWYGPNYVRDSVNAIKFSGADLVGKACTYIYFEEFGSTVLTYEGHEHRYTDFVRGATFCGPRSTFMENRFDAIPRSEDSSFLKGVLASGGTIYSADRFNFVVNRWSDKSNHTWKIDDVKLFASGTVAFQGNGVDQVAV